MRGKVRISSLLECEIGITPAYAGKRGGIPPHVHNLKDHPHLCGEKPPCGAGEPLMRGSPPPMRGKDHVESVLELQQWITPAYAGKRNQNRQLQNIS